MSAIGSAAVRVLVGGDEPPSSAWPDERLVRACREGDERAWNALIDKYKRLIYSIALRYHATPEDAADIFQSVCLDLFSELSRLRDASALRGWLMTVASHTALRVRRRSARRDQVERPDVDASLVGETQPCSEEEREALERAQELRESVSRLPERCQAMLRMLFFEDPPRPYADVAASLGLATGSIGFIRGRCLEKLRKVIAGNAPSGVRSCPR
jgi:RNA polymerase sigma factor (sigma-70 family)